MSRQGIKAGDAFVVLGVELEGEDLKAAQKAVKQMQHGTDIMGLGKEGAVAFGAIATAIGFASMQAGDYAAEMTRVSMLVSEAYKDQIHWAESYATATGYARATTLQTTNVFLAMARGMGFTTDQSIVFSRQMTQLTTDFATFAKIPMTEAMTRMKSAMSGSGEVLDMFGINVKQTALDQELLAQGFKSTSQGATEQQKMLARLAIIHRSLNEQGATGAGIFMQTLPKAFDQFKGSLSNLTIAIGEAFIPVVQFMLRAVTKIITAVTNFARRAKVLTFVLGSVVLAITGLIGSLVIVGGAMFIYGKIMLTVIKLKKLWTVVTASQIVSELTLAKVLAYTKAAMAASAGPIGVITGLFLAMGAAVAMVADKEDPIRKFLDILQNPSLPMLDRLEAGFRFLMRASAWLENRILNLLGPLKKVYDFGQKTGPFASASFLRDWIYGKTAIDKDEFDKETETIVGKFADSLGLKMDELSGTKLNASVTPLPEALEFGTKKAMEIFYRKSTETQQLDELKKHTALLDAVRAGIDGISGASTRASIPYRVEPL